MQQQNIITENGGKTPVPKSWTNQLSSLDQPNQKTDKFNTPSITTLSQTSYITSQFTSVHIPDFRLPTFVLLCIMAISVTEEI